jgi:hypothetical protein
MLLLHTINEENTLSTFRVYGALYISLKTEVLTPSVLIKAGQKGDTTGYDTSWDA